MYSDVSFAKTKSSSVEIMVEGHIGNKRKKRNVSFWQFSHKFLQSWVLQWNTCVPINIERLNLAIVHSHQSAPLANGPSYFGVNLVFAGPYLRTSRSSLIFDLQLLLITSGQLAILTRVHLLIPKWQKSLHTSELKTSSLKFDISSVSFCIDKRELNLTWASIYD